MTPSGIEPATFRFVAQYLNHCATTVPNYGESQIERFVSCQILIMECYVWLTENYDTELEMYIKDRLL
jgi:hypothetical protein